MQAVFPQILLHRSESEERKIAYPNRLFDCSIIDGRARLCSVLTPTFGNNQGMTSRVRQVLNLFFPPSCLRPFWGPPCNVLGTWRILGRGTTDGVRGTLGHKDGPMQGTTSCRQGEVAWKL